MLEPADKGGPGPGSESPLPGEHWPALESIDYVSKLIILIVLLLALPWLISKLLTAPHELTEHAAGASMGVASMGA
ncbi:MAG TPA: hypothetical protein VNY83_07480 [Solirubrobacterales bacterium]|nr:hypothetical protein [Solirubrobacterales bacterium]